MNDSANRRNARILLVEADAACADLLTGVLGDTCRLTVANTGEKALRQAAATPPPDLVLLAWQLPDMSGQDVCRALQNSPLTATVPIIFLTRHSDIDSQVLAFAAGAVDCLCIPLSPPLVAARVHAQLARAEQRRHMKQRKEQLETLSQELEAFSYAVSHDLRAPLRAIRGFSEALMEDCSEALGEQGQDYVRRVLTASQRMDELIVDMLALSRVSRAQLQTARVDLSQLVRTAADQIRQQYPGTTTTLTVQDNLQVRGDAKLLRIAVENLLDNAWKFTAKTAQPQIEFGRRTEAGTPVYYIMDNGTGFDTRYADKLFVPFQRLHNHEDYPGTGIGLATVHRVINRHGGRIWGTSNNGQGAEFSFTLDSETDPEPDQAKN